MPPLTPLTGEAITWPPPPSDAAPSAIGASDDDSSDDDTPCAIRNPGVANEKTQNISAACFIKKCLQ